jgi:fatty acid-binding protein DegV
MTALAIVTDSSSQLDPVVARDRGIDVVPIGIVMDGQVQDETSLDVDAFYERLLGGLRVTTSTPSPGRFEEAYRAAAARGASDVLSVHLDGRVSGTVTAARLAAESQPVPVTVVDAQTVSFGTGVCVLAAADAAANGTAVGELTDVIARLAPRIGSAFVAGSPPAGRVQGRGEALTVMSFAEGSTAAPVECDDLEHAASVIAARVPSDAPLMAAVGHAHELTAEAADGLAERLRPVPNVTDVLRYRVSPSVGAHTGPVCFGMFWWPWCGRKSGDFRPGAERASPPRL